MIGAGRPACCGHLCHLRLSGRETPLGQRRRHGRRLSRNLGAQCAPWRLAPAAAVRARGSARIRRRPPATTAQLRCSRARRGVVRRWWPRHHRLGPSAIWEHRIVRSRQNREPGPTTAAPDRTRTGGALWPGRMRPVSARRLVLPSTPCSANGAATALLVGGFKASPNPPGRRCTRGPAPCFGQFSYWSSELGSDLVRAEQ